MIETCDLSSHTNAIHSNGTDEVNINRRTWHPIDSSVMLVVMTATKEMIDRED
jgi:hypothetical protein